MILADSLLQSICNGLPCAFLEPILRVAIVQLVQLARISILSHEDDYKRIFKYSRYIFSLI